VIDSIAAGEAKKGKAVLRSGAKVGDLIFLTGELGGAAGGLKMLENNVKYGNSNCENLLLRQLQPNPQTNRTNSWRKFGDAMIDLSDGFRAI
jgi:thiamine-monophosphate kinase